MVKGARGAYAGEVHDAVQFRREKNVALVLGGGKQRRWDGRAVVGVSFGMAGVLALTFALQPSNALLAASAGLLLVASWQRPPLALGMWFLFLPALSAAELDSHRNAAAAALSVPLVLAVGVRLCLTTRGRGLRLPREQLVPVALAGVFCGAVMLASLNSGGFGNLHLAVLAIGYLIVGFIFAYVASTRPDAKALILSGMIAGGVMAILLGLFVGGEGGRFSLRAADQSGGVRQLGWPLALAVIATISILIYGAGGVGRRKGMSQGATIGVWLLGLVLVAFLVASGSRGSTLAAGVAIVIGLIMALRHYAVGRHWLLTSGAIVGLVTVSVLFWPTVLETADIDQERVRNLYVVEQFTDNVRFQMWGEVADRLDAQDILLGTGVFSFRDHSGRYAHGVPVALLFETGVLGLGAWLLLLMLTGARALKARDGHALMILAFSLAFFTGGDLRSPLPWVILGCAYGWALANAMKPSRQVLGCAHLSANGLQNSGV